MFFRKKKPKARTNTNFDNKCEAEMLTYFDDESEAEMMRTPTLTFSALPILQ